MVKYTHFCLLQKCPCSCNMNIFRQLSRREAEFFPILLQGVHFHLLLWLTKSHQQQWSPLVAVAVQSHPAPSCSPDLGVVAGVQGAPRDHRPEQVGTARGSMQFVQLSTAGQGIAPMCSALKAAFCFQGQARRKQIYKAM